MERDYDPSGNQGRPTRSDIATAVIFGAWIAFMLNAPRIAGWF